MSQDIATPHPVRVLIVDDSAFMRTALSRMVASESGFAIAGTARSGADALDKIAALDPDVVTLDIEMPGLDGLETLRLIMNQFPRPVIMVSSSTEQGADNTFDALAAGAFDYVPKQLSSTSLDILHIRQDLIAKIRAAAQSGKLSRAQLYSKKPSQSSVSGSCSNASAVVPAIIALGASTGGPKALQEILPLFPRDLAVPILIVQHMPPGFAGPFAHRMNILCSVIVREASHGEPIQPGVVYIAPAGAHMTVERKSLSRTIVCLHRGSLDSHTPGTQAEDCQHIPSIDILMKSVAEVFRNLAVGVIMTGMGSDGAQGMKAIFSQGGLTLGQDEASCTVYSMPRACAELGVLTRVVPLSEIPAQILQATRYRRRA